MNPIKRTNEAVAVVLADLIGLETENFHDHVIWLAFCDPHDIPTELQDVYDYEVMGRKIAHELYLKAFKEGTEEDMDLFWISLQSPWDVKSFAMRWDINLERLCRERISLRNEPIRNANEALHIVHAIGVDAPKYFDALKYIVNGNNDVTAAMLENTLDMIDQVCNDIGVELDEVDGSKVYDIDTIINKVLDMTNK